MANFTAVFDACVLYPATLRDILMRVAATDLFRARWSEAIHEEWTRNLLAKRPDISEAQLQRTVELMNRAVPDCLVTNYERLIPLLEMPDQDDRHVLAAAVRCEADVIVTVNLKDFPAEVLEPYEIEAQHPDVFLSHLFDLNPVVFSNAVRGHRESLINPPKDAQELLDIYLGQGLAVTVTKLQSMIELL